MPAAAIANRCHRRLCRSEPVPGFEEKTVVISDVAERGFVARLIPDNPAGYRPVVAEIVFHGYPLKGPVFSFQAENRGQKSQLNGVVAEATGKPVKY
jgi:hypothetical protein